VAQRETEQGLQLIPFKPQEVLLLQAQTEGNYSASSFRIISCLFVPTAENSLSALGDLLIKSKSAN